MFRSKGLKIQDKKKINQHNVLMWILISCALVIQSEFIIRFSFFLLLRTHWITNHFTGCPNIDHCFISIQFIQSWSNEQNSVLISFHLFFKTYKAFLKFLNILYDVSQTVVNLKKIVFDKIVSKCAVFFRIIFVNKRTLQNKLYLVESHRTNHLK